MFPLVWLVISKDFVPSFFCIGVELQRLFSIYFKITKKKNRNWSYFGNFGIVEICLKVLNCSTHSFELFTFFSKQIKRNSRIQISCIFSIFFLFFIKKIKKQAQTILINSQHNFYISFWWLTIRKKRQIIDLEVFSTILTSAFIFFSNCYFNCKYKWIVILILQFVNLCQLISTVCHLWNFRSHKHF